MDKQEKEMMFRRVQEIIEVYDMSNYFKRHGAIYIENLELKIKEELIRKIRKEIL